ncbi:MAG: glutamine synthetase [Actinophytocola sp.]|nr:glutamine synthetase [Actinophytocola sp.]MPZ84388.1 glutamine synthetase [Actinophytocola sp.]
MIAHERPGGPRTLAARSAAVPALADALRSEVDGGAVTAVVLLVPDPHARFAAVEVGAPFFLDTVLPSGYGVCSYVFAWTPEREAVAAPVFAPYTDTYGDLRMRPDLATLAPLPGAPGTWLVVCDVDWPDGRPVPIAPRTVLGDQLRVAESREFVPSVGLEHEVTFTGADGSPVVSAGLDYATGGLDAVRPLLAAVRSDVDALGLGVESRRGECHPGQYESVLGHRDALAACDDAMLQQLVIRRAAAAHGVRAGYLAAERAGAGSSCHVHLSLSDVDDRPWSAGLLDRFAAGVLTAAPDLTAIWAPTWNSYVRLRTAPFAPRDVRAGADDRTAAVRIAGSGDALRIEARFAGADAQPHLVVAALLAAGLWGIEEELAAPAPGRLHDTPWTALRALDESALARKLLGDAMVDARVALLAEELTTCLETVTDWQRRRGDRRT